MPTKGESTKKMIIDTAAGLFSKKGFKDVSMTDICEATGLSRGGLYRHFSSTSEIFIRLISTEQSFNERIKAKEKATEILKSALSELEKEILDPKRSLSLAIYEFASIDDNRKLFTDLEKKARKKWMDLISYGIETGEFNPVDPEEIAELLLYYYQGIRMWSRVTDIKRKSAKNYSNLILRMLTGEDK
jgi:AcrR family transcriptional regulator